MDMGRWTLRGVRLANNDEPQDCILELKMDGSRSREETQEKQFGRLSAGVESHSCRWQ